MNKVKIFLIVLLAVAGAILIYYLCDGNEKSKPKNAINEYSNIKEKNIFVYKNIDEIISIIKKSEGIIFLCNKNNISCQNYINILDEVSKKNSIDKIYYLDIKKDIEDNSIKYQELLAYIKNYLTIDENSVYNINIPSLLFVKDNKVSYYEISSADEYWNNETELNNLKTDLQNYYDNY